MELPIRGAAEQAFLDVENQALYEHEGKNPFEKAERLRERFKALSTPDVYGRAGIKAVIDLDKSDFATGALRYELRADEKTKIELDGVTNSIKSVLVVPIGEARNAIDRSHPYRIEIGNQNTPFTLKHTLKNQTNYNIAVETALGVALNEINAKKSEAQQPKPDNIVAARQLASQRAAERPRTPAMPPQ